MTPGTPPDDLGITYHRGPLGYSICRNGKPVGAIRGRSGRGWILSLPGYSWPPHEQSVAAKFGSKATNCRVFPKLMDAMIWAREKLSEGS